jgi:hypothetical protein
MAGLKDNLKRWREAAEIDWFSQFIKAWIPFNAWLTDTYGDLTDRALLDRVKSGGNVVFNRITPMLDKSKDDSQDAQELRFHVAELHRLLQGCVIASRHGQVAFTTVDIGPNTIKDDKRTKWKRDFRVRRDHPNKLEVTLEITATKTRVAFSLTLPGHDRTALEDNPGFQALENSHQAELRAMFDAVAPRKITSVLAPHGASGTLTFGGTAFVADSAKIFSALVDISYCLRNALFHGSITPNDTHNDIYKPAYHIVMRLVRCTL